MAISKMRQLSLLLPKELLDQLLFYLQGLESVQIHDLRQEEDWQAAFEQALVGRPDRQLSQQDLLSRQEKLERLIAELEPFMPKKKLLESLKEKPLELSFAALEQAGKARDEEALLEGISKQLKVLQEAKDQIEPDCLGATGTNTASSCDFQSSGSFDWDDSQYRRRCSAPGSGSTS